MSQRARPSSTSTTRRLRPHYPVWLRYEVYTTPMARGYWVHNLEHGWIVLLHRRDAPASVVTDLTNAYRSLPADPSAAMPARS